MRPIQKWCRENGVPMCSLAARVGIGNSHLTHIDKGEKGCSLLLASRIEKETRFGVTMADLVKLREGKDE